MRRATARWAWVLCTISLAACAAAIPLPPADPGPRTHDVRIVSNGWHAVVIVERTDLQATGLLPEAEDLPDAKFLEFGWGDRIYFPAREKTLGMTLEAALTATPAVMHMAGLARSPELTYMDIEVVTVAMTQDGFRRLVGAIAGEFERPVGERAPPVSRGLYADSNFYNAHGSFHLFNTCNTWTARMLRASGVNLSPSGVITADDLMTRLRDAMTR